MPSKYNLPQTVTPQNFDAYVAKVVELEELHPWLKIIVLGAAGKLNSIGPERTAAVAAFLTELDAHPEFMPTDVGTTHAPTKEATLKFLKRMLDRLDDHRKRLQEAIYLAADDLYSDGLAYYANAQLAEKREVPDAAITVSNLKPHFGKGGGKKKTTTPPANS